MSITNFLLARIAEDEAVARAAAESELMHNAAPWPAVKASGTWTADRGMIYSEPTEDNEWGHMLYDNEGASALSMPNEAADHIARHDPARVLAECAAKRAIVELANDANQSDAELDYKAGYTVPARLLTGDAILRTLAAVYAEHQDYRAEWRVGS